MFHETLLLVKKKLWLTGIDHRPTGHDAGACTIWLQLHFCNLSRVPSVNHVILLEERETRLGLVAATCCSTFGLCLTHVNCQIAGRVGTFP